MRIVLIISLAFWYLLAAPAGAEESFDLACPALTQPLTIRDPVPVDARIADRVLDKGWNVWAQVGESDVSIWKKLSVLSPRYAGVVVKCEATVGNVSITASVGLVRTSCEPDQERKLFRCKKY